MKHRNGFVSNSSSSSFIVAFPKESDNFYISYEQRMKFLNFEDTEDPTEKLKQDIVYYMFEQEVGRFSHLEYCGRKEKRSFIAKEVSSIREDVLNTCWLHFLYKKKYPDTEEGRKEHDNDANVLAKKVWKDFKNKHPNYLFLRFNYADHTTVGNIMIDFLTGLVKRGDAIISDYH